MNTGLRITYDPRAWKKVFFPVWVGQAFSLLGSQVVQFALIWYLTQTTGSATVLATAALVAVLPTVILGPIAGVLVDRWNRQVVMILADATTAGSTVVLIALFAAGAVQIWHIYAILCLRAIGQGLQNPAMLAATSLMVPEDDLTRVQGLNQAFQGVMAVLAAPLGAVLLDLLPMQGVLAVDIVTATLAIAPLCIVRIPAISSPGASQGVGAVLRDLQAGFVYVFSWRGLALLVGMATLINMMVSPAFALLPLLVKNHLGGGVMELGLLNALLGAGMLTGGILLGIWGGFKRRMDTATMGLVGLSLGLVLMGLAPRTALPVAAVAMLLVGLALPVITGPAMAAIEAIVDPGMQGRVTSLMISLGAGAAPIALAVAGPLADVLGPRAWFLAAGAMCACMTAGMRLVPAVLHIEDSREAHGRGTEGAAIA